MTLRTPGRPRALLAVRNFVPLCMFALVIAPIPAAHAQEQLWIRQFGTSAHEDAKGLAIDGVGGVFVAGRTRGDLGGPSAGDYDAYLARHDENGDQVWIRQFGTSLRESSDSLATDGAGGVIIAGSTGGSLGGTSAGSSDAYLARYDEDGNQLWIRQFGTSGNDNALALAPDGEGGVFVAGTTGGSLGGPSAGGSDAFLARYNSAGDQLWIEQFGTNGADRIWALAPDGAGGVIAAGGTNGSIAGANVGEWDAFSAHFSSAGTQLWIRQFGTVWSEEALAIAPDGAGGAFVGGQTRGSLGGTSAGGDDAFVVRYNQSGNQLWARQLGTDWNEFTTGLASDGNGGAIVTGWTSAHLGGTNPTIGESDAFMAHYNAGGGQIWLDQFGSASNDEPSAIVYDGVGNVIVAGLTDGDLGGPSAGRDDAFLTKFTILIDTDDDGLFDDWEINGIPYDGGAGLTLRYMLPGANPLHKDLYIEVDAMTGLGLSSEAIARLETAFWQAPLSNPDGFDGVTLHVLRDETTLPRVAVWQTNGCWPLDFDSVRSSWYGTSAERGVGNPAALLEAKAKAYRYCIMADRAGPKAIGGCGQRPGDNFVCFSRGYPVQHEAAVFMHEFGHNLGLQHGGGDSVNGKPNYPSVMNYVLSYRYNWNQAFWTLDFSRVDAGNYTSLVESSLNELSGVGTSSGYYRDYMMPFGVNELDTGGNTVRAIKYVRLNGSATDFGDLAGTMFQDGRNWDPSVAQDLNYAVDPPAGISLPSASSFPQTLDPYDDWAQVGLALRSTLGAGVPAISYPTDELTDEARAWINANFPTPPSPCYADCDQSGVLDIFDFLCFQNSFVLGEPYACDCAPDPVCDIFDFLCFQNAFVAGCP